MRERVSKIVEKMSETIPVRKNVIKSVADFAVIYDEPLINELKGWSYPNHFFSYFKKDATQLVVMFQGHVGRKRMTLPIFQRWSWAEAIDASVVVLNDPTLWGNDLNIGWWQGEQEQYALPIACEFVELLIDCLGHTKQDVLFFGSSAGGFVALMMAGHCEGSMALVNNPQTNILSYHEPHVRNLLNIKFGGISKEEASKQYPNRFSVSAFFQSIPSIPRIIYYQNTKDDFHFENHYLPLVNFIYQSGSDPNEFHSILYTHPYGHDPLEKVKMIAIINDSLAELKNSKQRGKLKEIPKKFQSINLPIVVKKKS